MKSKVIVITGASSGIGAALAKNLGAKGHRIVLAARREKELAQAAAAAGTKTLAVTADVTRREDVERIRDAALAEFGAVDVWVSNAGRGIGRKILDMTDDDLDEMIAVNLKSVFYGMQTIVPHFQQRGEGHLINVSSFLGRVPLVSFRAAYNAAKSAVNSLTANLRMDMKADYPNIHITLVMPGVVLTDFPKNALHGTPQMPGPGATYQAQTADEAADAIARAIENPVAEVYTNPAQIGLAIKYFQDVAAFEDNMLKR